MGKQEGQDPLLICFGALQGFEAPAMTEAEPGTTPLRIVTGRVKAEKTA
jgi:hypothetical protein